MTWNRTLAALGLLCLAGLARAEPSFLRGVGGLSLTGDADVQYIIRDLVPRGFNHVQASFDATSPATARRISALHKAGVTVYDYCSAYPDQAGLDGEYQIRADGSVKQGLVCPRSRKRLDQMVRTALDAAKAGADGICWDFITVESAEKDACFCDKCVKALADALGRPLTRQQAVAAIDDPATLQVWRKVREESTTAAIRYVCENVHAALTGRKTPFSVGGYVIGSHSDLGMDTGAMYKYLDVGAPMIYQGREAAPIGWMLGALKGFQAYGGRARNVVCVDAGFWVDEPWQELLTTCYDCIRGRAAGYCLWPVAMVSTDDLQAMASLNRLDDAVFEPIRNGKASAVATGLRAFDKRPGDPSAAKAVGDLAAKLQADPQYAFTDDFALAVWPYLTAEVERELKARHAADMVADIPPYRVRVTDDGSGAAISTSDWAMAWDSQSENIGQVVYRGLRGNAATGTANLGLMRLRVIGWADLWGAHNNTVVVSRDAQHISLRTSVRSDVCEIARVVTVRRHDPWIGVELSVRNLDRKEHGGKLWLWNGFGIPGMLERDPDNPWADDVTELKDNTVTVSDEGCGLSISADPADLQLGAFGGDGCSHSYKDIKLGPGETFTTKLKMRLWRR